MGSDPCLSWGLQWKVHWCVPVLAVLSLEEPTDPVPEIFKDQFQFNFGSSFFLKLRFDSNSGFSFFIFVLGAVLVVI
jgi:hypothetical protein